MNAVAPQSSNAVGALQNLRSGLANVQATMPQSSGDTLLKFSKGDWSYGAERIEVEEGSRWAINPLSLMHGWVSWDSDAATLEGEVLVPMTDPLPAKGSLPNTGFPWDEQLSLQFKCVSGEDTGEQVLHKTSSVGGVGAIRELIKAIMRQLDKDPNRPVPVVTLGSDSYPHKKWGKVYTPVLEIVEWLPMDGAPAEEPKLHEQAQAEPEAVASAEETGQDEPASDDAAPRRRRRRQA